MGNDFGRLLSESGKMTELNPLRRRRPASPGTGSTSVEPSSGHLNTYQATTSPGKLRGQFYTPPGLVELIFRSLELSPESLIVDPSCGDGAFLLGALSELHRRFPQKPPEHWLERIAGFDVDPAAVSDAQERLRAGARTL